VVVQHLLFIYLTCSLFEHVNFVYMYVDARLARGLTSMLCKKLVNRMIVVSEIEGHLFALCIFWLVLLTVYQ
jgi:hypothetical protein